MENYSIILVILALMAGLSAWADKLKMAAPILLVTAGIAIGFIPSMPVMGLNPDIIFLLFLPPLLYDAAFNINFGTFRTHASTISALAVGLVFLTTGGIALLGHYLMGLSWPVAFVLGSVLAATDAVAAMGITKGLGLSHTAATVLEGESLVNDASALVAYRFAVAAVGGAAFSFWQASLNFVVLLAGGFAVGLVIGRLLGVLLRFIREQTLAVLSFLLLTPFITYLLAEEIHVSGVIAVVTLGLTMSRLSVLSFPEALQQQAKAIWDVIIFLLNGFIFLLIGLEFPVAAKMIEPARLVPYTCFALLITVAALVLRTVRVYLQRVDLLRAFTAQAKLQDTDRRKVPQEALLTVQESIIISWSGMRGIVSLAMVIALPAVLSNGQAFPMREALIFISTMVVLFSILGQGLLLPSIVRRTEVHKGVYKVER